jgi:hypothetical protein
MHQRCFTQMPFALAGLLGQDMAGQRFSSFDFAGAGLLEPFGGGSISFKLRHQISFNRANIFDIKYNGNKNLW